MKARSSMRSSPPGLPTVTELKFTHAPDLMRRDGLRGWISCLVEGIKLDGITVFDEPGRGPMLVFPLVGARDGRQGQRHPTLSPEQLSGLKTLLSVRIRMGGLLR